MAAESDGGAVRDIEGGAVNPGAGEWPHRQIAETIRERITRGDWAPGDRLPSIPQIGVIFGVAKQTAQRAVDQLRVEGVLITRPGSGTFVRGTRRRLNRTSRGRYGTRRGYHVDPAARYREDLVSVGRERAPSEVTRALGDGPLVARRYVLRTTDAIVELGVTWLRAADAAGRDDEPGLDSPAALHRPLYQAVEDATGRRYARATDALTARLPTRDEAATLQIRADTPVLTLLHTAYDTAGRPIEVTQATWPGPMTVLVDEYAVPAADERPPLDPVDAEPGAALA